MIEAGIPQHIKPETISGWREGQAFDVLAGEKLGFTYIKSPSRYSAVFGVIPDAQVQDPQDVLIHAMEVLDSIQDSMALDEPIVVYSLGTKTYLLHGALRLSCISAIRAMKPGSFQTVPALFFSGSPSQAKLAMIRYQSESQYRALSLSEQVHAVTAMVERHGIDHKEIISTMRWKNHPWYVKAMLGLSKKPKEELYVIDDAIRQWRNPSTRDGVKDPYQAAMEAGLEIYEGKPSRKKRVVSKSPVKKIASASKILKGVYKDMSVYQSDPECQAITDAILDLTEKIGNLKSTAAIAFASIPH